MSEKRTWDESRSPQWRYLLSKDSKEKREQEKREERFERAEGELTKRGVSKRKRASQERHRENRKLKSKSGREIVYSASPGGENSRYHNAEFEESRRYTNNKNTKIFDIEKANKVAADRMGQIGIDIRDPSQAVGTMSGGERQCLAISRAIYFGAKVLILDEPTSALGVHQASVVLKYIVKAATQGLGVILITHNVHHAYPVGNRFTILNRGKSMGTYSKQELSREKLLGMMAGGEELDKLEVELKEIDRIGNNNN